MSKLERALETIEEALKGVPVEVRTLRRIVAGRRIPKAIAIEATRVLGLEARRYASGEWVVDYPSRPYRMEHTG